MSEPTFKDALVHYEGTSSKCPAGHSYIGLSCAICAEAKTTALLKERLFASIESGVAPMRTCKHVTLTTDGWIRVLREWDFTGLRTIHVPTLCGSSLKFNKARHRANVMLKASDSGCVECEAKLRELIPVWRTRG